MNKKKGTRIIKGKWTLGQEQESKLWEKVSLPSGLRGLWDDDGSCLEVWRRCEDQRNCITSVHKKIATIFQGLFKGHITLSKATN